MEATSLNTSVNTPVWYSITKYKLGRMFSLKRHLPAPTREAPASQVGRDRTAAPAMSTGHIQTIRTPPVPAIGPVPVAT